MGSQSLGKIETGILCEKWPKLSFSFGAVQKVHTITYRLPMKGNVKINKLSCLCSP